MARNSRAASKQATKVLVKRTRERRWRRYWLAEFSLQQLRDYLRRDLRGIGVSNDTLDEEDRRWFLDLLKSTPQDPVFWEILKLAEKQERQALVYVDQEWLKTFLCKQFTQRYHKQAPVDWISSAARVLYVLLTIRDGARSDLQVAAFQAHKRWEGGEFSALKWAVSTGLVTEPWVNQAIAELQRKRLLGDQAERDQATARLRQIANALCRPGSGRQSSFSPEKQRELKRVRDAKHAIKRHHRQTAQRLVKKVNEQAARNKKYAKTAEQAMNEAVRYVVGTWEQTSRAKDKYTILKIVRQLLADE